MLFAISKGCDSWENMLLAALCLTEIMTSLCKDCGQVISISGASLEIHGGSAEVGRFLVAQKKVGAGLPAA